MARPTDLTSDKITQAEQMLPRCPCMTTLAAYLGVARSTLYAWLARAGEPGASDLHRRFADTIKKGLAEAEIRAVQAIKDAASDQWQAAAWLLERRWPDRWGRQAVTIRHMRRDLRQIRQRMP